LDYSIKSALAGPNARIEQYFPMACEGTDRRSLSRMGAAKQAWSVFER